jgi:hypothetical protein
MLPTTQNAAIFEWPHCIVYMPNMATKEALLKDHREAVEAITNALHGMTTHTRDIVEHEANMETIRVLQKRVEITRKALVEYGKR